MTEPATELSVAALQDRGWLLVEDGNHGEYRPRPSEFGTGDWAFIRAADMDDGGNVLFEQAQRINEVARARIRKGVGAPRDVLLSHKGTVGKVAFVPQDAPPFVCSPQTTFWRSLNPDKVDPRFLYYLLRSAEFQQQLRAREGETDMAPYVSLTAQRQLRVLLPSIHIQRAIAGLLGVLDDKIALNRRMNRTLEATASALFRSWFVDFDPVQFKAAGRSIGLSSSVEALFPADLESGDGDPLPRGWQLDLVYSATDVVYGAPFASEHFNARGDGRPLLRIRDLSDHSPQTWTTEEHARGSLITAGDIVVGMDGEFRAQIWRGPEAWLNQRVCSFRPKAPFGRAFVYFSIKGPLAEVERSEVGTTVIHLGKADIDKFRIVRAPDAVHRAFSQRTEPLLDLLVQNARESRTLSALRDTLLPQLLSGAIRLRQAEYAVTAAI